MTYGLMSLPMSFPNRRPAAALRTHDVLRTSIHSLQARHRKAAQTQDARRTTPGSVPRYSNNNPSRNADGPKMKEEEKLKLQASRKWPHVPSKNREHLTDEQPAPTLIQTDQGQDRDSLSPRSMNRAETEEGGGMNSPPGVSRLGRASRA